MCSMLMWINPITSSSSSQTTYVTHHLSKTNLCTLFTHWCVCMGFCVPWLSISVCLCAQNAEPNKIKRWKIWPLRRRSNCNMVKVFLFWIYLSYVACVYSYVWYIMLSNIICSDSFDWTYDCTKYVYISTVSFVTIILHVSCASMVFFLFCTWFGIAYDKY